jgi:hypothetical protein
MEKIYWAWNLLKEEDSVRLKNDSGVMLRLSNIRSVSRSAGESKDHLSISGFKEPERFMTFEVVRRYRVDLISAAHEKLQHETAVGTKFYIAHIRIREFRIMSHDTATFDGPAIHARPRFLRWLRP